MSVIDRKRAVERLREQTFGRFEITETTITDPLTRHREYIDIDSPHSVRHALARLSKKREATNAPRV
jgi:hypothetical protein